MRAIIITLLLATTGAAGWYFYPTQEAMSYTTSAANVGKVEKLVVSSGTLGAVTTVDVGSEVSGQIIELLVDYNDEVKAGQLVARLDDSSYVARVSQLEADVAMAKASLGEKEAGVLKALASLDKSKQDLNRTKSLVAKKFTSQSELDIALSTYKIAQAELAVAKAQVVSAKAYIQQKQANLDEARVDLESTQIRSPINGVVLNRLVSEGQTVAASMTTPVLFEIAGDLADMQIEAFIDEADIGQIKEGQKVRFTVDAWPDKTFVGKTSQVRKAATNSSSVVTYTVVIAVNNQGQLLLPGMTANTEIITSSSPSTLRIPNAALRFQPADKKQKASPAKRLIRQLASLDLSDEQISAIETEFNKIKPTKGATGPGSDQTRRAMRNRMDNLVRKVLTPEQFQAYKSNQASRRKAGAKGERTNIWVLDEKMQPQRLTIFTGIQDDTYTEVVGGDLKVDDAVITLAQKG